MSTPAPQPAPAPASQQSVGVTVRGLRKSYAGVAVLNEKISITFQSFFVNLRLIVELGDVLNGLFKSAVFAVVIGTVCCHQGLVTIGGPRGIGRSVTKAVVNSIVLILILDYFVTRFLMYFD